jgi:hypothetical protein
MQPIPPAADAPHGTSAAALAVAGMQLDVLRITADPA